MYVYVGGGGKGHFVTYLLPPPPSRALAVGGATRAELKELVRMHGEKHALDEEESTIIMGALEMIEKKAEDAMTPIENAFMLEETTLLDPDTIKQVLPRFPTERAAAHRTSPHSSSLRGAVVDGWGG
jgi:hypothetical protein